MKHQRKLFPLVALAACFGLLFTTALGDDPLKRGKGGGGGSSGGGSGGGERRDPPKREDPPKQDPPRQDPPKRQDPPRDPPRREDPPKREDPPRRETPPPSNDDPLRRGGGQKGGGGGGGSSSGGSNSGGSNSGGSNSGGSNSGGSVGGGQSNGGSQGGFPSRGGTMRDPDRGNSGSSQRNNGGNDDLLKKKPGSRSGTVQYGSNSNVRTGSFTVDRAPVDVRRGSLGNQVRRSDEIRINGVRIRYGYTHYNTRWCDDYFYYPHYVFDPYQADFACSPWYYYPQLPPYFNTRRCYFPATTTWFPFYGLRYNWNQPSRNNPTRDYSELDYTVEDIVAAFTDGDRRAVQRLTPRNGQVGIVMDGRFAYNLRSDDFYDTLLDAVENTRTRDYRILDVQYRRYTAAVYARHDFDDPWGRRVSVYHYFKLENEGRDWVIREFGTSNNRW